MEIIDILVDFHKYCPMCKHSDKKAYEDPCNDCMAEGTNQHTDKPVSFEKKE